MLTLIVAVFCIGYVAIALEHKFRIDKAAIALLTGGICWTLIMISDIQIFTSEGGIRVDAINIDLAHQLSEISGILFFLIGAMTIVELIDAHDGFRVITDNITTKNKVKLLWMLSIITFFLSSVLDNLTTAIIMVAVIRKMISDREELFRFGGMIVLASNAGGAWSPIGDVTTIMLWVGGQISALNIMAKLLIPSLVCLVVPLIFMSFAMKGEVAAPQVVQGEAMESKSYRERLVALIAGIIALVSVLFFKIATHLPPYLGMLISLGFMWVGSEILKRNREKHERQAITMVGILKRIDLPTLFFFLGILLAVGALRTSGILSSMANMLDENVNNIYAVNYLIGILSSIIDNVPLVAGAIGMYSLETYPMDHNFWELLSYCAGTGGSILIIGSAAGVAVMGILKIDFIWYFRKISLPAFLGYTGGIIAFYLLS